MRAGTASSIVYCALNDRRDIDIDDSFMFVSGTILLVHLIAVEGTETSFQYTHV